MSYKNKSCPGYFCYIMYYTTNVKLLESQFYSCRNSATSTTFGKYLDWENSEKKLKSQIPLWKYSHLPHEFMPNSTKSKNPTKRSREPQLDLFFRSHSSWWLCQLIVAILADLLGNQMAFSGYTLQTSSRLCIPLIDLAKPRFKYQLNISKTEL
jgi:hypothetical protein